MAESHKASTWKETIMREEVDEKQATYFVPGRCVSTDSSSRAIDTLPRNLTIKKSSLDSEVKVRFYQRLFARLHFPTKQFYPSKAYRYPYRSQHAEMIRYNMSLLIFKTASGVV
jgi:hypothetical protein